MSKLFTPYSKNGLTLKNHLVMAPMTRSRAIGNIPNELMAEYYGQRSGAGLIIVEGTSPSAHGLGYPRIPGVFSKEQTEGWKGVTAAAHANGSKIFLQLMHTGRIGHTANLPEGAKLVSSSATKAAGQIYTDALGMQDHSEPAAMTTEEVKATVQDHVAAAKNAIAAGFDGVELHGAHGYLVDQFLNPNVNTRTDEYGGSIEERIKIAVEIVAGMAAAIGNEKVGIRISPYIVAGDLQLYDADETNETYKRLAEEMEKIGIAFIDFSTATNTAQRTLDAVRAAYTGTIIWSNNLTPDTAEAALNNGIADIVAFGKAFLANPDLDKRIQTGAELNAIDFSTAFTPGAKGLTDYPVLQ